MKTTQAVWKASEGWRPEKPVLYQGVSQLLLVFGAPAALKNSALLQDLTELHPDAHVFGCSTAGEICGTEVYDDSLVVTAITFESTRIAGSLLPLHEVKDAHQAGEKLASALTREGLVHVFVLSDGLHVNGSDLVKGLRSQLPPSVSVTGGLAGDGGRFQETFVLWNGAPTAKAVAALGFYGASLTVGYGSLGGWDPFGPERLITKARGNVLYELDGQSALALYEKYLGEHAKGLPATGLLFPLRLRMNDTDPGIVRTILSVNKEEQSMTFAGDMPEGVHARFMKANFDRLIDGAVGAAQTSLHAQSLQPPDLAVLISCVGRKMILQQRTEEEVEGVRDVFGDSTVLAGFYSYGELSPFASGEPCELHNQTMTVTTFSERRP